MTLPSTLAESDELRALSAALAGRYIIERELGRGGMGVVYLARDKSLDRLVALKVLPTAFMAQHTLRERFLRETRMVAGMSHPNVVPIYAVEEHSGVIFYAMGFIDGETLTERVRRAGPLPAGEVARVLQEAAWALSYAHGRGIVHRDVKPDNILIERATGRALLLDFGISRVANSTMTSLGESLGTPQFMSPEQAAGEPADARSDLYSLGLVGFFALTGVVAFDAPSVQAILAMQITKPAPPIALARPGTPQGVATAIDRCLAKSPDGRWPSAEGLVAALQQARGAAAQDIAPQVRHFQRVAEMTTTTLITLCLLLPAVAIARPHAADLLLAVLGVFTFMAALQLSSYAQQLRDQGFTYDDVRAAFDADTRAGREAAAAARELTEPGRGRRLYRRRFWLLAAGILLFASGATLASRVHLHTTLGTLAAALLAVGIVLVGTYVASAFSSGESGRGANRIAVRWWSSAGGRLFFRLVARSRSAPAGTEVAPVTGTARYGATALLRTLPPVVRKELRDAPALLARLERLATSLAVRERELDRALGEVGGAADTAGADTALAASRASLIGDLKRSRDSAAAQQGEVLAALEELRLCFLRLRTRVGTPDDARAALDRARATATAAEAGLSAPRDDAAPATAASRTQLSLP